MNKPKFTPGPWSVDSGDPFLVTSDADGLFVAVTETEDRNDDECEANTHLIAAAPEMYEALAGLSTLICNVRDLYGNDASLWISKSETFAKAQAAIAKAEGSAA